MSSSRRAESVALLAVLALPGCMTIYPDPELPDIDVDWYDGDCRTGTGDVVLNLIDLDDATFHADRSQPCTDHETTFADVPRDRFRLEAVLRATTGETISNFDQPLDLRDGLDERAYVFFGNLYNVRVAWTFDMAASCASLAADGVLLDFSPAGGTDPISFGVECETTPLITEIPDGDYTLVARAVAGTITVAISPPTSELAIRHDMYTDVGTLVLSPCGSTCP